jgi:ABC-type glycerol-3-phosphate transport system substrate-binding protein
MYITGEAAMLYTFLFCPQDYSSYEKMSSSDTIFVGYPSIEDSGRVCRPGDMLGISAGTQYPDACWEFIKIMMSDEVQQKAVELNMIPVSQQAFDSLLNKAMHPELRTAAENVALVQNDKSAVSDDSIENFKEMVASLNCLDYYDVTLSSIIDEECAPCLSGDKSPADTVDVLNNRINLYLEE